MEDGKQKFCWVVERKQPQPANRNIKDMDTIGEGKNLHRQELVRFKPLVRAFKGNCDCENPEECRRQLIGRYSLEDIPLATNYGIVRKQYASGKCTRFIHQAYPALYITELTLAEHLTISLKPENEKDTEKYKELCERCFLVLCPKVEQE